MKNQNHIASSLALVLEILLLFILVITLVFVSAKAVKYIKDSHTVQSKQINPVVFDTIAVVSGQNNPPFFIIDGINSVRDTIISAYRILINTNAEDIHEAKETKETKAAR